MAEPAAGSAPGGEVAQAVTGAPARVRDLATGLGGVGGCLLLAVWGSPGYLDPVSPSVQGPWARPDTGVDLLTWFVTTVATVAALWALRWWPHLLALAAAVTVLLSADVVGPGHTRVVAGLADGAFALAIVAVLAGAQGWARTRPGRAAALAGAAIGARLFGPALAGATWLVLPGHLRAWHQGLAVLGLALALPAVWLLRGGDPSATGTPPDDRAGALSGRRVRPVAGVALAFCAAWAVAHVTRQRLASLLGVSVDSLARHPAAETAVLGAVLLVAAAVAAAAAGLWVLGGALIAATVQVAVSTPLLLAVATLALRGPAHPLGTLAGVALGLLAAASRWRVAASGALAVAAAVALFIAYGATGGHPQKLAVQQRTVPVLIILVLVMAATTCVVGATAPELGRRGLLPAASGPLAAVLAVGGLRTVNITYLHEGLPDSSYLNPVDHLTTSAVLLLVAAAAVAGFGSAQRLGTPRTPREDRPRPSG